MIIHVCVQPPTNKVQPGKFRQGVAQIMEQFTARKEVQAASGSKKPPSPWEQMESQGLAANYSKTLNIEGATVHIQQPSTKQLSGKALEDMRDKKKAAKLAKK